jgi:hypothetical protein
MWTQDGVLKRHGAVSLYTIVITSGSPVNPKEQLRNGNAAFGTADNPGSACRN